MRLRFNPPPNWPTVPPDWTPPPGWQPDPGLPALPPGWQLWVEDPDGPSLSGPVLVDSVVIDPGLGGSHPSSVPLAGEDLAAPPPVIHVRLGDPAPPPHPHRPSRLLTGLIVVVLALLAAGIAVGTQHQDDDASAVTSTPPASVPVTTATPESLSAWASSIRQPVLDIQAAVEDFVAAAPKRDRAGLQFACSAIQQGVSSAQQAGPAPDLAIATAFNQALSLYAQAASSCIQGVPDLDPAQLTASADAIRSATGHLTSMSTKLSHTI